jgi:non-lysosomal glucosylceramidase
VKFELDPGETKEIPFVLCWHFPLYESGPAEREARFYTQFLGKRRPDNAVVWLAEQAVENYGTEAATYRHWIKQIEDWQASVLQNSILSDEEKRRGFHGLAALLEADTSWTEEGRFDLLPTESMPAEALRAHLADAGPLVQAWPDIARHLTASSF